MAVDVYPDESEMDRESAETILRKIGQAAGNKPKSLAVCVQAATGDPFRVLVATLLSLRNRDEATGPAAERVLARWPIPEALAGASLEEIGREVLPSSLWKTKSRALKEVAGALVKHYGGKVPRTVEELVKIKWIGRKSANLISTLAYGEEGLCVDVHVRRTTNRLGIVKTENARQTEKALKSLLSKDLWTPLNDWLVWFGRTICRPIGPKCGECPVASSCPSRTPSLPGPASRPPRTRKTDRRPP